MGYHSSDGRVQIIMVNGHRSPFALLMWHSWCFVFLYGMLSWVSWFLYLYVPYVHVSLFSVAVRVASTAKMQSIESLQYGGVHDRERIRKHGYDGNHSKREDPHDTPQVVTATKLRYAALASLHRRSDQDSRKPMPKT